MPNKMRQGGRNLIQGGNTMKCSFCGKSFKSVDVDQDICEDCIHSVDELSDGKGEEDE